MYVHFVYNKMKASGESIYNIGVHLNKYDTYFRVFISLIVTILLFLSILYLWTTNSVEFNYIDIIYIFTVTFLIAIVLHIIYETIIHEAFSNIFGSNKSSSRAYTFEKYISFIQLYLLAIITYSFVGLLTFRVSITLIGIVIIGTIIMLYFYKNRLSIFLKKLKPKFHENEDLEKFIDEIKQQYPSFNIQFHLYKRHYGLKYFGYIKNGIITHVMSKEMMDIYSLDDLKMLIYFNVNVLFNVSKKDKIIRMLQILNYLWIPIIILIIFLDLPISMYFISIGLITLVIIHYLYLLKYIEYKAMLIAHAKQYITHGLGIEAYLNFRDKIKRLLFIPERTNWFLKFYYKVFDRNDITKLLKKVDYID